MKYHDIVKMNLANDMEMEQSNDLLNVLTIIGKVGVVVVIALQVIKMFVW